MNPTPHSTPDSPGLFSRFFASSWLRPLNDLSALEDLVSLVDPFLSLTRVRARVVARHRETPDAVTLTLQPNHLWKGHRAGQHVGVEVELDGRRLHRVFSLSSPPTGDGLLRITVKQHERGKVSAWWNRRAGVGDIVTLTQAAGAFVLPSPLPLRIVMLSGGSGVTPLMAMLRELHGSRAGVDVVFVQAARSREDTIFAAELERLAREWPRLDLRLHFSSEKGRLDATAMAALAAEARDAVTFACGPTGFLELVREAWRDAGLEQSLHEERFGAPRRESSVKGSHAVVTTQAGREFEAHEGRSLLEEAEAAGLRPAHGCRVGICHTCKCRKLSGVVEDLRDGSLHAEDGETIQLCVMSARSAVTLDL